MTNEKTKIFKATLAGSCSICKKEMIGTRIAKDRKTGQYAHADCIWPQKVNTGTSTTLARNSGAGRYAGTPESYTISTSPQRSKTLQEEKGTRREGTAGITQQPSYEEKVKARLSKATGIAKEEFPGCEDFNDYLTMVQEIFYQLFAEESMDKIQAGKQKNIEAIR